MTHGELTGWHKSTRSAHQGGCVEVGDAPGVVGIRDTKNRAAGTLVVDRVTFSAFLDAIKADRVGRL
ncbi:DUF397 domain-containing protein [Actinoalloteichus hymeniacidonis]|uniref:DUF397 family protein n=1 Tax=Actinoalloteichus hymeniacidonis TaxID=340345 RepID=A0AAC9HTF3_9PSEU|nr:DUF397 domain-containing protein [Actinoalloteichus hymeniacidonis]AOS64175.1 putative DUF397 family protein [Actinoalloteichus hymeniacidonis]MBB5907757.1 hypothetical protein [Actinoalloteichus hymeniacidonis]